MRCDDSDGYDDETEHGMRLIYIVAIVTTVTFWEISYFALRKSVNFKIWATLKAH